ncbi:MAG: recombinase zinc beta ribbon domain-containing protein [Planctomycetes bacterium]|nr:recombinase zinc beta ribbon domain-containing protein [Planctomycetota bacterium]
MLENDPADWIITKNTHPPIVSRHELSAARARQKERSKNYRRNYRRGRGAKSPYLLTGLIKCARCGHNWQGYTKQAGRKNDDGSVIKNYYYACGGYVTKGNSVCQKSLIQSDAIENMLIDEIGLNLDEFINEGGDELLRKVLTEIVSGDVPSSSAELSELRLKKSAIESKINNILDNITEANREFADKRITDLKRELYDFLPRLEELEAASENHIDIDELMLSVRDYMKRFKEIVQTGTVDEKRTFLRAFTHSIELDPETGEGNVEILSLPRLTDVPMLTTRYEPPTGNSSLLMVAEEGFEPPTRGL